MHIQRRSIGAGEGLYFNSSHPVFSSGSTLLNCALGGGWAKDRVINVVGDRSTGKTLLGIEAAANFVRSYEKAKIDYIECEAAFDEPYAQSVGFPSSAELIRDIRTVEAFFNHLTKLPKGERFVVLDSLDAIGDEEENKKNLGDHGYGAAKPKLLSEAFRRLVGDMADKHITLFIISQTRDNIGNVWGPKQTRSGGKALDFYATQILWLKQTGKLEKEIDKVKRVLGIEIQAAVTKNKIGPAFRDAPVEILFNYGMDDLHANLFWLSKFAPDQIEAMQLPKRVSHQYDRLKDRELQGRLSIVAQEVWRKIEQQFDLGVTKYEEPK